MLHNLRSNYSQAVEVLEKSVKLNPDDVHTKLALGDSLERAKETKKAISVFRDLMQSGHQIIGLKEKLEYLENCYEEELKAKFLL